MYSAKSWHLLRKSTSCSDFFVKFKPDVQYLLFSSLFHSFPFQYFSHRFQDVFPFVPIFSPVFLIFRHLFPHIFPAFPFFLAFFSNLFALFSQGQVSTELHRTPPDVVRLRQKMDPELHVREECRWVGKFPREFRGFLFFLAEKGIEVDQVLEKNFWSRCDECGFLE